MLNCFGCVQFGAVASCQSIQLPVARGQWPVASCRQWVLPVAIAAARSNSLAAAKHCHSAHAKHPLHLHELPRLLSLFPLPLSLLSTPPPLYLLLSDCPQKAAQQKIEFPVRTDSIWRCNFTLCYCKVAATAAPGQDCARSHSQSWPKIAIFSYGGNTKKAKKSEPKFSFSDELSAKTDSARYSMSEQTLPSAVSSLASGHVQPWHCQVHGKLHGQYLHPARRGLDAVWECVGEGVRSVCAICDRASIGFLAPLFHVSLFGVLERPLTPFCAVLTGFVLAIVPSLFPLHSPLSLALHTAVAAQLLTDCLPRASAILEHDLFMQFLA